MMKEILVAVDGSKHSEKVVDYATDLAKSMSARIVLVYVMPKIVVPEEYRQYAEEERLDPSGYFEAVGEKITAQMGRRIEKKGVEHEGIYKTGNPAAKILEIAESKTVSMIVVGLHGLHGLARIRAMGSTARRIIENSTVPVAVVP